MRAYFESDKRACNKIHGTEMMMERYIGRIKTGNAQDEKLTILYDDFKKTYLLLSNKNRTKIELSEREMERLFSALDDIENYK